MNDSLDFKFYKIFIEDYKYLVEFSIF